MSVAVDDTTVFGPRSIACLSPIPPDFEEIAKNEGQCSSCTKNNKTPASMHTISTQIITEGHKDRW